MAKTGKDSCTERSRHIDIWYFFVKDRCNKKKVEIKDCPTEKMIADFLAKPLVGTLFIRFK